MGEKRNSGGGGENPRCHPRCINPCTVATVVCMYITTTFFCMNLSRNLPGNNWYVTFKLIFTVSMNY